MTWPGDCLKRTASLSKVRLPTNHSAYRTESDSFAHRCPAARETGRRDQERGDGRHVRNGGRPCALGSLCRSALQWGWPSCVIAELLRVFCCPRRVTCRAPATHAARQNLPRSSSFLLLCICTSDFSSRTRSITLLLAIHSSARA